MTAARRFPIAVLLNRSQARQIVKLLGELQGHIEADIESLLIGDKEPEDTPSQMELHYLRAERKKAEDLVKEISSKLPPSRGDG